MENNNGVKSLSKLNFEKHSLWKYDEEDDLYYPVFMPDEFPEDVCDLFVKSNFFTPHGHKFTGYIVGIPLSGRRVYCIGIFDSGDEYIFNLNMPDDAKKQFGFMIRNIFKKSDMKISDVFPLKFETTINLDSYNELSGEFDAFEKLKNGM